MLGPVLDGLPAAELPSPQLIPTLRVNGRTCREQHPRALPANGGTVPKGFLDPWRAKVMRRRKRVPLPVLDSERTAFGVPRTRCGCEECVAYCKHLPGYLIPEDLGRMVPEGHDPLEWAREHLRASPGAVVADRAGGRRWRIPTLVPARAASGACIFLDEHDCCSIHVDAPFGCALLRSATHNPSDDSCRLVR
jgi:hypothetical protein